ncbi:hypothetical protein GCM10023257_08020 [Streptomyces hyderabadensis]|uniref:Uncharacterized protein n=1 Tax=Streptomyces hyderabadensis TaxID=598549 RepID=A0ABP9HLP3_9ACTN
MTFCVAATRSGRFSCDQTVISRSGLPGPVLLAQPESNPIPKAAVTPTAVVLDRRVLMRMECPRSAYVCSSRITASLLLVDKT